jgi:MFS family permease
MSTPPKVGRLLAAAASLVLSGSASLTAQIVIQKYVGVVSGGMDAFIMYAISFSFIGGLGLGAILAGRFAGRIGKLAVAWSGVEWLSATVVFGFLRAFAALHAVMVSTFGRFFTSAAPYYAYIFVLQFLTSLVLATAMGLNYPLAFEVISRLLGRRGRGSVVFVVATNAAGGAVGALATVLVLPYFALTTISSAASITYLGAGVLALMVGRTNSAATTESGEPVGRTPLGIRRASGLLLVSGAAGFALELTLFRHFTIQHPEEYWVCTWCSGRPGRPSAH